METITQLEIDRPVGDVFAFMTDLDNAPEWATELVDVEYDGDISLGATGTDMRKFAGKTIGMPWEVTEYDEPRRVVFHYRTPFEITASFEFEALGDSRTRMTCRSVLRPTGLWRLLSPMLRREAQKTDTVQFARAKELLEGRAA